MYLIIPFQGCLCRSCPGENPAVIAVYDRGRQSAKTPPLTNEEENRRWFWTAKECWKLAGVALPLLSSDFCLQLSLIWLKYLFTAILQHGEGAGKSCCFYSNVRVSCCQLVGFLLMFTLPVCYVDMLFWWISLTISKFWLVKKVWNLCLNSCPFCWLYILIFLKDRLLPH